MESKIEEQRRILLTILLGRKWDNNGGDWCIPMEDVFLVCNDKLAATVMDEKTGFFELVLTEKGKKFLQEE